jgi:integrase/recombinase XerC
MVFKVVWQMKNIEAFLDDLRLQDRRPDTIRNYRQTLTQFFKATGKTDAKDITIQDLKHFLVEYKAHVKPNSYFITVARLSTFFKNTNRKIYGELKKIRLKFEETYLEIEPIEKNVFLQLLKLLGEHHHGRRKGTVYQVICLILISAGVRIGELLSLNREDVAETKDGFYCLTFKPKTTKIGKPKKVFIPKFSEAGNSLRHYLNVEWKGKDKRDALFLNCMGKRVSRHSVEVHVSRCGRKLGLTVKCTPHVLRHTYVTVMRDRNVDAKTIAANTGHSERTLMRIYDHVRDERKKQIAQTHQVI